MDVLSQDQDQGQTDWCNVPTALTWAYQWYFCTRLHSNLLVCLSDHHTRLATVLGGGKVRARKAVMGSTLCISTVLMIQSWKSRQQTDCEPATIIQCLSFLIVKFVCWSMLVDWMWVISDCKQKSSFTCRRIHNPFCWIFDDVETLNERLHVTALFPLLSRK